VRPSDDIRSLKIACSGSAGTGGTAQQKQAGQLKQQSQPKGN